MSHNSIVVGLKHGKPRFIEIGHNDLPCWQDWSDLDVPTMELLVQKAFNQRFNAGGLNDSLEITWRQRSTSNQTAIDVVLRKQVGGVSWFARTAVEQWNLRSNVFAKGFRQPAADALVHVLCLLCGSRHACANGPNGLVRDNDVLHLVDRQAQHRSLELLEHHVFCPTTFAFLQGLTATEHGQQIRSNQRIHLGATTASSSPNRARRSLCPTIARPRCMTSTCLPCILRYAPKPSALTFWAKTKRPSGLPRAPSQVRCWDRHHHIHPTVGRQPRSHAIHPP